jgi:hypothetical protein
MSSTAQSLGLGQSPTVFAPPAQSLGLGQSRTPMDTSLDQSAMLTIFYSNYSGNCKALLQLINNANLMDKLSLKFINIDNEEMKNVVMKKFSVVPTLVVMVGDEISLYTGDNAFEWFNIFIQNGGSSSPQNNQIQNNDINQPNTELITQLPDYGPKDPPENPPKTILELAAELSKARENL